MTAKFFVYKIKIRNVQLNIQWVFTAYFDLRDTIKPMEITWKVCVIVLM